jgi:hypothetical protein
MFAADLMYSLFAYADMENYLDHPLSHSHKQTLSPSSSTLLRSERMIKVYVLFTPFSSPLDSEFLHCS